MSQQLCALLRAGILSTGGSESLSLGRGLLCLGPCPTLGQEVKSFCVFGSVSVAQAGLEVDE